MRKSVLSPLFFLILMFGCGACHAAEKVMVSHIEGGPMIVRNGQEIPATVGAECRSNDVLKTTDGCMVDVSLNDKIGCRVLPSSNVLLASANDQNTQIKVNEGNVILNVEKLRGSSFKVETPTAIASVRGTQFWGRVMGPGGDNSVTTFAVRKGRVDILAKTQNKSFSITAGQALDISNAAGAEPAVRPALAEELKAMEQASTVKTTA